MAPKLLSKSKLIAFRQCPRRLWLEVHKPELREDSAGAEARMEAGNELGRLARKLYDPEGKGETIDFQEIGFGKALERSKAVLAQAKPVFEAGYSANGALAFADVMLPVSRGAGEPAWRMVEVKSSTSVKDYHREDASIQAYIARNAGVPLQSIAVAHIDSQFVYPGDERYDGLLVEEDLTAETDSLRSQVEQWIGAAHEVAARPTEPEVRTGGQCSDPFQCGFYHYCSAGEPKPEMPVSWLPRIQKQELKHFIETRSITDLRDVPDGYLSEIQLRVKRATIAGKPFFDKGGAARELSSHGLPACFLDFETVQFAIPVWKGTRPYQQLPFQFSLHKLSADGELTHSEFLDLTGADPSLAFAEALVVSCAGRGPVFVYNAQFEAGRIRELGERVPRLAGALSAVASRIVDVLPVARRYYYHPDQHGSWSIKAVLPSMVPELDYDALSGIKDGQMASAGFLEAIRPDTTPERREELRRQLLEYCWLDTYALVRVWAHLGGHSDIRMK
jgi:CRISPR/Cas system-associated exonuclease Cas4 (RecB family)